MDNLIIYLIPFLISFSCSVFFILVIKFLVDRFRLSGHKLRLESRHIHIENISRFGGLAIAGAFFVAILLDKNLILTRDIWGILFGGVLIFILGFCDDLWEIGWKKQLFFQSLAVLLIFIFGVKINFITNPWGDVIYLNSNVGFFIGIVMGLIWSLILINAMNWFDGIDGLSGGIYLMGLLAIFFLSLKPEVNQPPVGILALTLAGAVLGFLIFNFPPARIMAGSSGVFFVGFVIAGLSIFAGTKIATTLLVLLIPMLDFFWVISKRLRSKRSIFSPDKEHLHHKLLGIGWSQKKIDIFFYLITSFILGIALTVEGLGKTVIIVFLAGAMLIFYNFINKKEGILSKTDE